MADAGGKAGGQAADGVGHAIVIAIGGVKAEAALLVVEREADAGDRGAVAGKEHRHADRAG